MGRTQRAATPLLAEIRDADAIGLGARTRAQIDPVTTSVANSA
jgi:hypothetical protein